MLLLVRLLLLAVAVTAAPQGSSYSRGYERFRMQPPITSYPEGVACLDAVMPSMNRMLSGMRHAQSCVEEQPGLHGTVLGLFAAKFVESVRNPHNWESRNPSDYITSEILEEAGMMKEAFALRKCFAKKMGYIPEGSNEINIEILKAEFLPLAAGSEVEANLNLGFDSCSKLPLTRYDYVTYSHCVLSYCATKAAPQ